MPSAVESPGLTKRYGELVAVGHISFEANKGEIFGFCGPNGAGKTTTISMLISLVTPTEGTARLDAQTNNAARNDIAIPNRTPMLISPIRASLCKNRKAIASKKTDPNSRRAALPCFKRVLTFSS
ncbi:MAG: ATP-binding cassette domain-containing protein [Candidatus Methanosuratincola petrocarbonis]